MLIRIFLIFHKSSLPQNSHISIGSYPFSMPPIPVSRKNRGSFQLIGFFIKLRFKNSTFTRPKDIGKVARRMKIRIYPYPRSSYRKHLFHLSRWYTILINATTRFLSKVYITSFWMGNCRNNMITTRKKYMWLLKFFFSQKHNNRNRSCFPICPVIHK